MNFHKLINRITKANESKTLWKNSKSSLELVKLDFIPDYPYSHETILEAEFICQSDLEEKFIEFNKMLKWLEKHKEIIEIDTNINFKHIQMLGSDYLELYKSNFTVSFKI